MRSAQPRHSLLLCRPVGLEGVRTTPLYRIIAERMARKGVASLRFDYFGTADAAGEERDQSMASWADDVLEAHQLLVREVPVDAVWFGMRLGANLALHAAAMSRQPPASIVLWDPVTNGRSYLDAVLASHRREVADGKGVTWERILARGVEPEPKLPGNVLGFEFSDALVDELLRIDLSALGTVLRRGVAVSLASDAEVVEGLRLQSDSPNLTSSVLGPQPDWLRTQADGTPVAPPDIFVALRRALGVA